jgi:DNA processing protein
MRAKGMPLIHYANRQEKESYMSKQITGRKIIIYLAMKYQGNWNKIYEAIKQKELVSEEVVEETLSQLKSKVVTIIDENYPEMLKKSYKPPFVLFYYGNLNLLNDSKRLLSLLDVSTSDTMNEWAREMTQSISLVSVFNEKKLIIDKHPIYVYNQGLDKVKATNATLFKLIEKSGLIMSEYPEDTPLNDDNTPFMYRILASIGNALLVNGLNEKSKETIAVGYTMYLGKNIYCANSSLQVNKFHQKLIDDGAIEVKNPQELVSNILGTKSERNVNLTA